MLSLNNVSCGYGKGFVVKNVSFTIEKGDRLCVLGPNGSGKSTMLKAAAGLMEYEGNVTVSCRSELYSIETCNKEIGNMSRKEVARRIAVVTQTPNFYFPYTVFEVVSFGRFAWKDGWFGRLTADDREWIYNALEAVGMYELKDRPVSALSGGQFQKVFLAKAFAQNPDIMLLDEPTNHLDIKSQYEFMERLDEWANRGQKTVLAVLHDINLAFANFGNVLLMNDGQAAFLGSVRQLKDDVMLERVFGVNVKEKMVAALSAWGD